jgi:hypothetical protein
MCALNFFKFELENFGKYVPNFLYKDKNRKMGLKRNMGLEREKISTMCLQRKATLCNLIAKINL